MHSIARSLHESIHTGALGLSGQVRDRRHTVHNHVRLLYCKVVMGAYIGRLYLQASGI